MSRLPNAVGALGEAEIAAAFGGLENAPHILVAVSGGPDSTALMGMLAEWGRPFSTLISAATVDHGLRPEARSEAEMIGRLARQLGLPHAILAWTGRKGEGVSQDAARRARYRLLVVHGREIGATHLLTAHTRDDQAETLMLRLAAGSGLSGLGGMRREVARGGLKHVRPFLDVSKDRLVATCRERGWPFVEDPSNADPRFARVRWRRNIMPLLAGEGLDATRLALFADRLARADAALERAANSAFANVASRTGAELSLDLRALCAEPEEIALRVLKRALQDGPREGTDHLRLERLEACLGALMQARTAGMPVRRTLAGRLLRLDKGGTLTISPEGVRRRGLREAVTPIENPVSPSLGREPGRA